MGQIVDKIKGKAKQVEGILTGDKVRQGEGALQEAKGEAKSVVNKVKDAAVNAVDAVKQAVKKI